ncbi:MAG: hypothetical protein ABH821_01360, partial [archaeon]
MNKKLTGIVFLLAVMFLFAGIPAVSANENDLIEITKMKTDKKHYFKGEVEPTLEMNFEFQDTINDSFEIFVKLIRPNGQTHTIETTCEQEERVIGAPTNNEPLNGSCSGIVENLRGFGKYNVFALITNSEGEEAFKDYQFHYWPNKGINVKFLKFDS